MHNRAPHLRSELAKLVREDELQLSRADITERTILSLGKLFISLISWVVWSWLAGLRAVRHSEAEQTRYARP